MIDCMEKKDNKVVYVSDFMGKSKGERKKKVRKEYEGKL